MGRIVKAASVTGGYTVSVPSANGHSVAPHMPEADERFGGQQFGDDPFESAIASASMPAPAPEPTVDFDAVRRDAEAIIDRAAADAEAMIRDAQQRALLLVEEAQSSASFIESQARERGHEAGYTAGAAAAKAELVEAIASIHELVENGRRDRHAFMLGAENELVRLAMVIAERVIHQQVSVEPSIVLDNVRQALTRLVAREAVTLRVNPADLETIRQHRDAIVASSDVEHLRIVEDQRVDRGGVVVETEAGTIDAKIATQIREARKVVGIEEPIAMAPSAGDDVLQASVQAS